MRKLLLPVYYSLMMSRKASSSQPDLEEELSRARSFASKCLLAPPNDPRSDDQLMHLAEGIVLIREERDVLNDLGFGFGFGGSDGKRRFGGSGGSKGKTEKRWRSLQASRLIFFASREDRTTANVRLKLEYWSSRELEWKLRQGKRDDQSLRLSNLYHGWSNSDVNTYFMENDEIVKCGDHEAVLRFSNYLRAKKCFNENGQLKIKGVPVLVVFERSDCPPYLPPERERKRSSTETSSSVKSRSPLPARNISSSSTAGISTSNHAGAQERFTQLPAKSSRKRTADSVPDLGLSKETSVKLEGIVSSDLMTKRTRVETETVQIPPHLPVDERSDQGLPGGFLRMYELVPLYKHLIRELVTTNLASRNFAEKTMDLILSLGYTNSTLQEEVDAATRNVTQWAMGKYRLLQKHFQETEPQVDLFVVTETILNYLLLEKKKDCETDRVSN